MSNVSEEVQEKRTSFAIMASSVKKDFIPTLAELNTINSYMMCKWLSNHPVGIEVANFINNATDLPIEVQYQFVRATMHNIRYISFPKKTSPIDDVLDIISDHYKCSYSIAKQYYKILPEAEVEKILKKYKHIGRVKL
jgi:hypothetical protein